MTSDNLGASGGDVRLDAEWNFNPRKSVADVSRYVERAAERSAASRATFFGRYDVLYGSGSLGSLDVFPAPQPEAPIHVFLHGGYWRGRDKRDYSYLANALVPAGITTVIMNYDLCPAVTVPDIVGQVRAGLGWITANAVSLGGSARCITLSGHSAGAHLAAMALAADSPAPLPAGTIRHATLISGIYDLGPVLDISVNETIRLAPEQVEPMSPLYHLPRTDVPLRIVVGGDEPPGWIAQSRDFAEACRANGSQTTYGEVEGRHHYSIMALAEERSDLLARMIIDVAT